MHSHLAATGRTWPFPVDGGAVAWDVEGARRATRILCLSQPPMSKPSSPTRPAPRAAPHSDASSPPFEISYRIAAAVYLALATIYFLPAFLPGQQMFGVDYLAASYYSYDFIRERLAAGELPKWVPYLFGGLPNMASPGSTYHPVVLLGSHLLATERVFALMFLVHFWLGALGMYALARELGCRSWVAFVAGLAFGFTGLIASWVYAGHDGRVIAATMIPATFFFLRRGVRTASAAPFVGAAAAMGLALLSFQIQVVYYLFLGAGIWGVYCVIHYARARSAAGNARVVALGLASVAAACALAAVILVPFAGYVPESPRGESGGRGYDYAVSYSMPVSGVLSMAVPEQYGASVSDPTSGEPLFPQYSVPGGFKLHTEYVGAWVILMLVVGAALARRNRDWQFMAGLSLFSLTLALGGNTPLYRLYFAALPGIDRFRAPDLAFCLISFATVVMAALAMEALAAAASAPVRATVRAQPAEDPATRHVTWTILGVVAIAFLGALVSSAGASEPGPSRAAGWMRFTLFAGMIGAVILLWLRGTLAPRVAAVLLALFVTADLWVVGKRFFHTYPPPVQVAAADDVVDFLKAQRGPFRVWTLTIPQTYHGGGAYGSNYLMAHGIDQVGGEHPNPLQRWHEYLGEGKQTYIDWHRVMIDPQVVETPAGQAIAFRSTPGFLEAANVRYIIAMAPLAIPGLREVHRGSALVYENTRALPRAFLAASAVPVAAERTLAAMGSGSWNPQAVAYVEPGAGVTLPAGPLQGSANVVEYTPDRITVATQASRSALLVLADNYYPGWRATVDGREVPIVRTNHIFRGVVVPAGAHRVVFTYAPADLRSGFLISLVTLLLLVAAGAASLLMRRKRA